MATRKAAKKRGPSDTAADEIVGNDVVAKAPRTKITDSSTPFRVEPEGPAAVGDDHGVPLPKASKGRSEGRAPPAGRSPRGRARGSVRTPQRSGRSNSPHLRSPKHRDRTPARALKHKTDKPPRIAFEEDAEPEAGAHEEDKEEPHEDDPHAYEVADTMPHDEYSVSYVDEDVTLMDRDFYDTHDDTRDHTREHGATRDPRLIEEWKRVPRNFILPTFEGGKENVLPFLDGLLHTFETWSIAPEVQVQFAFAQVRDRTARDWMKKNPTRDFATFRSKFLERFGSHTLRRDALRALRDIRQTGNSNQGFVAAFEHVLEELEHHNLILGEPELLLFLQLAVNERVRDALEWRDFDNVRAALHKIANLAAGQTYTAPRSEPPRGVHHSPAARIPPATSRQQMPRRFPSGQHGASGGPQPRRCHGCGSEDHLIAQCPQASHGPPAGRVPFNNGRGHQGSQGNGNRPRRW